MPKIDVLTISGMKVGKTDLPKEIFAAKINKPLMAQAVRVYLSNQRQARAKVKTRGEVAKTTAKWYRQKGTGRARHGAQSAPLFVGGGVAHGPTGKQNYKRKLSKKMKKLALFSALTSKFKNKEMVVIKGLEKMKPKTKEMVKIMQKSKLKSQNDKSKLKILIILPQTMENVNRAARNIEGVNLIQANLLNVYRVLNGGKLVFMKEAIDKLKKTFL